jgi:metal-responsive CopG/Arc/MetJ family transcriptional regulator
MEVSKGVGKVIQVPVDDSLLTALDAVSKEQGHSRSETIRRACRDYLARQRVSALEDAYEAGYRRVPESNAVGAAQAIIAAESLSEESW